MGHDNNEEIITYRPLRNSGYFYAEVAVIYNIEKKTFITKMTFSRYRSVKSNNTYTCTKYVPCGSYLFSLIPWYEIWFSLSSVWPTVILQIRYHFKR